MSSGDRSFSLPVTTTVKFVSARLNSCLKNFQILVSYQLSLSHLNTYMKCEYTPHTFLINFVIFLVALSVDIDPSLVSPNPGVSVTCQPLTSSLTILVVTPIALDQDLNLDILLIFPDVSI